MVTLLLTPLVTTHEPPSTRCVYCVVSMAIIFTITTMTSTTVIACS